MVDVLVLNYNDALTTIEYIQRVKNYSNIRRILVVDNYSTDDSLTMLSKYKSEKINIISSTRNGGYGAGNNLGIRYLAEHYKSEYILLSNPDIIIEEATISALEEFLKSHQDYAVVAPFMLNPKGEHQYNTAFRIPKRAEYIMSLEMIFSKLVKSFYYSDIENENSLFKQVGSVSGSLFLMNAEKMLNYGMYDENIFLYCEEVTLGIRLRDAGQKVALLPRETFIHNHSVSINKSYKNEVEKKKQLVKSKLYVIEKYYNATGIVSFLAHCLGHLAVLETKIITLGDRK